MKKALFILMCVLLVTWAYPSFSAGEASGTLLPACINQDNKQKWGYINESGEFVIKPQYDAANNFNSKGLAVVANNIYVNDVSEICSIYFIDKNGKVALGPYSCSYVPDFKNGYAIINEDGKGGKLISEDGKIVLRSQYWIESISEGMVKIYEKQPSGFKYGFMGLEGNVVVPLKYLQAEDFKGGSAWVQTVAGKYELIDKQENVIETADYYDISQPRGDDQLIPYQDKGKAQFGYKTPDGKTAISPRFSEAQKFYDGLAVVSVETGEYETKQALIDTKGEYVLKPEYSSINSIGHGLFAVTRNGYSHWQHLYYPHAIFDREGKQLTDYCYYNIEAFNGDYASACSDTQTFFIDKDAKIADNLPKLQGIGRLEESSGDIIKAEIDGILSYYRNDGSLIWEQNNNDLTLDGGIKVKRNRFRSDFYTFIEYPELEGIADLKVQEKINEKLKEYFIRETEETIPSNETEEYFQDNRIGFAVDKNKDLLIVRLDGYSYPIGAAHGMPYQEYYHIDLKTGNFYSLKDLFKSGAKYADRLTSLIRKQIELNLKIKDEDLSFYYLEEKPTVTGATGFTVTGDALQVYFAPYEIAAYAAGFVTFDIPYGQISDLIDSKSPFWNSFSKEIVKSKINLLNFNDEKISAAIQDQLKAYESKIIDAVNTNDFKKVEPTLLKGSSLYDSQKKLVQDLFKKGIKEKLVGFEIYAIGYSSKKEYKVYVSEDVAIKYPPKSSYTTKEFSWCYTVKADDKTGTYKLSSIEKW